MFGPPSRCSSINPMHHSIFAVMSVFILTVLVMSPFFLASTVSITCGKLLPSLYSSQVFSRVLLSWSRLLSGRVYCYMFSVGAMFMPRSPSGLLSRTALLAYQGSFIVYVGISHSCILFLISMEHARLNLSPSAQTPKTLNCRCKVGLQQCYTNKPYLFSGSTSLTPIRDASKRHRKGQSFCLSLNATL